MARKVNTVLGVGLLGLVAALIIFMPNIVNWLRLIGVIPQPLTQLYVYGGYRYFQDPEIQAILQRQYHLDVQGEFEMGTSAMSKNYDPAKKKVDCIFPGSKLGVPSFEQAHPKVIRKFTAVAQDRIILYTWAKYLPTLEKAGLVTGKDKSWFIRMKPMVDAMIAGQRWTDLGADIPGYVRVESTDPIQSSTGQQWLAFVGTYLVPGNEAGGAILTMDDLQADPTILERLYAYWEDQGAQIDTTKRLFDRFVASGAGIPMMVAYESSFADWYSPLSDDQKAMAAQIVGLYPEFTINVEHTLASLTPACDPLVTAINDPKIQQLAWKNHGLYPQGYIPSGCAPGASWCALTVPLIPEPKKEVTDTIKGELK